MIMSFIFLYGRRGRTIDFFLALFWFQLILGPAHISLGVVFCFYFFIKAGLRPGLCLYNRGCGAVSLDAFSFARKYFKSFY